MKKLGVLVMALVFILSASVYSFADERVTFNGQYRASAIMNQNPTFDSDADNDRYYWSQRFRLPVTFNISEAVSAHLRFDFAEGKWGQDFTDWDGWAVPTVDPDTGARNMMQTDRAYMQVSQDMYTLKVGQHWNGVGNYIIWDQQSTGITLDLNMPLNITLNYSKVSEGDNATVMNLTDEDDWNSEDTDFYGVNLGYDQDNWNINALFAMQNDYSDNDQSPYAVGVYGAVALDMLNFWGEVDYLGGDDGNNDYKGLQGIFDASFDMNDMFTVGGTFVYAKGYEDADETQITSIRAGAGTFDAVGFGGNLNAWGAPFYLVGQQTQQGGLFNFTGDGAGAVGGRLYADAAFSDKLDAYLRLGYLTPEEDDATNVDSAITAAGNIAYQWLPSTTLSAGMAAVAPDYDDNTEDDTNILGIAQIQVDW